jgi:hypothetical protein
MQAVEDAMSTVDARVEDVLPKLGLAFVVDAQSQSWGVTRSTPGTEFDALAPGRRVRLQIQAHPLFSVVREFSLLD